MLQKGRSVLWSAAYKENSDIVLLLLQHGAVVNLPNDVRHSNTMYTVDIDATTCYLWSYICSYYLHSHM